MTMCLTPCRKVDQNLLGNLLVETGSSTHPPYSPDIVPSDYHLFRSMAYGLADQHLRTYEKVKNWIDTWIASKDEQFFRRGLRTLPERSEKGVASDGQYFES